MFSFWDLSEVFIKIKIKKDERKGEIVEDERKGICLCYKESLSAANYWYCYCYYVLLILSIINNISYK